MVINCLGDNYFKIQSGNTVVLVDPTNARSLRGAQVVLSTIKPSSSVPDGDGLPGQGDFVWIDHQGEFEASEVNVRGYSAGYDEKTNTERTIYKVLIDEINLVLLGQIHKEPDKELEGNLRGADVLIVPVGKQYLSEEVAAKLVRRLEPATVIVSSKDPSKFYKEFGKSKLELEEKLVFKKKDLRPGTMEIKCLKS
ncbi:MAG: MBL fold metallo-hydrolase [Patescibacteria group bacterium]